MKIISYNPVEFEMSAVNNHLIAALRFTQNHLAGKTIPVTEVEDIATNFGSEPLPGKDDYSKLRNELHDGVQGWAGASALASSYNPVEIQFIESCLGFYEGWIDGRNPRIQDVDMQGAEIADCPNVSVYEIDRLLDLVGVAS